MDTKYLRVSEDAQPIEDDTTKLLHDLETGEDEPLATQARRGHIGKTSWFFVTLAVSNLTTLFVTMDYAKGWYSEDVLGQVNAAYGGDINRDLTVRRFAPFNFTSSQYTRPPNEEVDQAWADLGVWLPHFILPKHLGSTFGLNNSHFWIPRETLGTEGYPVVPEMIHHLHCLNSLRMNLYYNHGYYAEQRMRKGKQIPEQFMVSHINHCVDALRERLFCTADIGITPFLWRNEKGETMPDFAREHRCHDHMSVIAWYNKHAVSGEEGDVEVVPPAEAVFHPPEEFMKQ